MNDLKLHTLYIKLPDEWENKLYSIYKECCAKYNNEYLDDANWKAHITIGTHLLEDQDSKKFVEVCEKILQNTQPFHIHFAGFSQNSDGKYIFLDFDQDANQKVLELRSQYVNKTNSVFGSPNILDRYLENFNQYSHTEQKRIRETGSPHKFTPHISIVKLEPHESDELSKELENHELLGEGFTADTFDVSCQSDDPENMFPIIKIFKLPLK